MRNIVVLGSINTDLVVHTAQFPKPGETVIGSDVHTMPGGKGANQAVAATRLGAPVFMIGCVGNDTFGLKALENLKRQKVDTQHVRLDPSTPSGMAFILINAHGDNSIIVSPGANEQLTQDDLDRSADLFNDQTILVVQLEISTSIVMAGIRLAREQGSHIILNPSPASKAEPSILKDVETLILNETELFTLSRCSTIKTGLRTLQEMGARQIVLTLGAQGCILISKDLETSIPAHAVNVVDTTGAGDAFMGAFATAIANDYDFMTAGLWGNAAGGLAATSLGAQSSLPDREQLAGLLGNYQTMPDNTGGQK